jgi:acyl-CoA reductase-like NAD-dependent aldehyde dehydrogenase
VITNVPAGDKADVDLAVRAARRAFDERRWTKISPSERGRILWRIADLIERNLEELAELESIDNGKPYAVARVADLPLAVDMFRYMVAGRPRSGARRCRYRCRANIFPTLSASRSAWSDRSFPGTSRC